MNRNRLTIAQYEAARQKIRQLHDLNRPIPSGELWLDRAECRAIQASTPFRSSGNTRVTDEMRRTLRRYRDLAGISAAALSRKAGLPQSFVHNVEGNGIRYVDSHVWRELTAVCKEQILARAAEFEALQNEWEAA